MGRKAKPFSEYPSWVLNTIQRMASGEDLIQLPPMERNTAISSSHVFNRGRAAYVRELAGNSNMVELALDIVARVVPLEAQKPGVAAGTYSLEFTRRGLAILADESRGSKRGIPSPLREDGLQDFDKLLVNLEPSEGMEGFMDGFMKEGQGPMENAGTNQGPSGERGGNQGPMENAGKNTAEEKPLDAVNDADGAIQPDPDAI